MARYKLNVTKNNFECTKEATSVPEITNNSNNQSAD